MPAKTVAKKAAVAKKVPAAKKVAAATTKKAAATKPATKPAAAKKTSAPISGDVKVLLPGQEGYNDQLVKRGKVDHVSPVMDPILKQVIESGEDQFQMVTGDPFGVNQIRNWSYKAVALPFFPEGKKLSISGGFDGKNIGIKIVDVKEKKAAKAK